MQKMPTKIQVSLLVLNKKQVLLGKRVKPSGEGVWGLPERLLGNKEKLIDAAQSIAREYLNIEQSSLDLEIITDDVMRKNHFVHCVFVLKDFDGNIDLMRPDKHSEWKFFSLTELPEDIYEGHKDIFKTFFSGNFYLY